MDLLRSSSFQLKTIRSGHISAARDGYLSNRLLLANSLSPRADMQSRPVQGFTFEDSVPLTSGDSTNFAVGWRTNRLDEVVGRISTIGRQR